MATKDWDTHRETQYTWQGKRDHIYIFLLIQMKSRQQEQRTKVRPLQPAGRHLRSVPGMAAERVPAREPALLLRRTATY